MQEIEFYICPICGNIAVKLEDAGIPLMCCGALMEAMPSVRMFGSQRCPCRRAYIYP